MPCGVLPFLPTNPSHMAAAAAPALFDDASREWMSYGALRERMSQVSPHFAKKTRDLIFCCAPRSIDGVVSYLSACASGHAVAVIDPALPNLQELVATYQPAWIIAPTQNEFSSYQSCENIFASLKIWKRKNSSELSIHPDLYLLFLTSGSTGSPKTVRLSYENLARNTTAIVSSLGLTSSVRAAGHLPLSYSFGLSVLHMQLAVGGGCLLSERGMMSREFWQAARDESITLLPGVPYHFEMMQRLGLERLGVPALKTFIQAGGKMRADLKQLFLQYVQNSNGELFIMYGQTEASPRMSCLPLHEFPEKIDTAGRVLDGGKFEILDGEIVYEGPNVMLGYAQNRADLALGDSQHRRLATGDNGSIDQEGFLTIAARKQNFAKLFGNRIALDDVEGLAGSVAHVVALETADKIVLVTASAEENVCERIKQAIVSGTKFPPTWIDVKKNILHPPSAERQD